MNSADSWWKDREEIKKPLLELAVKFDAKYYCMSQENGFENQRIAEQLWAMENGLSNPLSS